MADAEAHRTCRHCGERIFRVHQDAAAHVLLEVVHDERTCGERRDVRSPRAPGSADGERRWG